MPEKVILTEIKNDIGRIILNRPEALNALNMELVEQLSEVLHTWRDNPQVEKVIISANGRAFCSGGDLKMAYDAINRNDLDFADTFFRKEYSLNALIHHYPKPYIAILNGITMGGGMGLSIHGSQRIVTENAMLCMPETSIGFFPDVGGTYFLNQCPGSIGMFLGLTSFRMSPADALFAGLATHYIESAKLDENFDLNACVTTIPGSYLEQNYEEINKNFSKSSLAEIFSSLQNSSNQFAKDTLQKLNVLSPSSLNTAFTMLHNARNMTFDQAIETELEMSKYFVRHPDFKEGIRAAVIDKDQRPIWSHTL